MHIRPLKYIAAFTLPLTAAVSFTSEGWFTFLPLLYAFVLIPVVERLAGQHPANLKDAERELVRRDPLYDVILYLTVPLQVAFVVWFLFSVSAVDVTTLDIAGRTTAMGLMCGVFGINVAHELGHRATQFEKILAKIMLCTSLYLHFYIEHNRGHHRNVGTAADPATARRGEAIYFFWLRTLVFSFLSAWNIVDKERTRKQQAVWSLGNEMIQYMLIQFVVLGAIAYFFSGHALLLFVLAAAMGMLLLETVNYIEHYGLTRKKASNHRYEDVQAWHSWNSDFIIGRIVLFELTRHSDHHRDPSRHYPELDSYPEALQLPAGYPAMMLLSLVPPLWFRVVDHRIPPSL